MRLANRRQPSRQRRRLMGCCMLAKVFTKLRRRRGNRAAPSGKSIQIFAVGEFGIRGRGRGRILFGGEGAFGFHGFIIYDNDTLSDVMNFLNYGLRGEAVAR